MLPFILKPENTFELIRLGKNNDGGYLIEKKTAEKTKNLISFGLADDWSFEKEFKKFNKDINIKCYDHTVNNRYWSVYLWHNIGRLIFFKISIKKFLEQIKKFFDYKRFFSSNRVLHFERALGVGDLNNAISVLQASDNLENIFLKIDVEGAEYRALEDIIIIQDRLEGLVIEFHNIDIFMDKIINFVKNFKLKIVHIHANNADFVHKNIPSMIEVTFAKNPKKIKELPSIPHKLDQICEPTRRDINLIFDD